MSEWQPIETAPKNGKHVLLWCPWLNDPVNMGYVSVGSFREDDYAHDDGPTWLDDSHDDFSTGYASRPLRATHWMPLPEPPK